jgi:hypothetical protein
MSDAICPGCPLGDGGFCWGFGQAKSAELRVQCDMVVACSGSHDCGDPANLYPQVKSES